MHRERAVLRGFTDIFMMSASLSWEWGCSFDFDGAFSALKSVLGVFSPGAQNTANPAAVGYETYAIDISLRARVTLLLLQHILNSAVRPACKPESKTHSISLLGVSSHPHIFQAPTMSHAHYSSELQSSRPLFLRQACDAGEQCHCG